MLHLPIRAGGVTRGEEMTKAQWPIKADSPAICRRGLTHCTQSFRRATGHSARMPRSCGEPNSRRQRLPHCQRSARSANPGRTAFRSTYRATARKCRSSYTGKLLVLEKGWLPCARRFGGTDAECLLNLATPRTFPRMPRHSCCGRLSFPHPTGSERFPRPRQINAATHPVLLPAVTPKNEK